MTSTHMKYFLLALTLGGNNITIKNTGFDVKIKYNKKLNCAVKDLEKIIKDYEINFGISVMPKSEGKEEIIKDLKYCIGCLQERLTELEAEDE